MVAADIGKRWTLKALATVVNRSPSYLNALFYRTTGLTIRQYTLFLRMTKAVAEIEDGVKITAVAVLVGFHSRKNFYRQFKAWFGRTPTDLRGSGRSRRDS